MLQELHIESMGVIETLDLVLRPGLTAFTGETGAGKTMVVEAINLLVGGASGARRVWKHRARTQPRLGSRAGSWSATTSTSFPE